MMNRTNSNDNSETPVRFDQQLRLVEQIVLATIFISAVLGNMLVLIVMLTTRHRRTRRMVFFIFHLTIADLLVAFFSVLPMLIWKSTPTFYGGDLVCRLITFLMLMSTYISVYTLVVMTLDRYQAIVHPLTTYTWTSSRALLHMVIVWCVSILLASPQLFIFRLEHDVIHGRKACTAKFLGNHHTGELIYIIWTIIAQFILPVCVIIFCYSSVYIIVNRSFSMYRLSDDLQATKIPLNKLPASTIIIDRKKKKVPNRHGRIRYPSVESSSTTTTTMLNKPLPIMYPVVFRLCRSSLDSSTHRSSNSLDGQRIRQRPAASHFLSRARLKTIKLTFIVVLTYILCSTPFYIGSIIMAVNGKFLSQKTMNWLMTIFSLLLNLNSCSNPVICLTLSSTLFRRRRDPKQLLGASRKSQTNNENFLLQKNLKHPSRHFILL